nr:hypothetical protein [Burkholderia sp. BCC1644]
MRSRDGGRFEQGEPLVNPNIYGHVQFCFSFLIRCLYHAIPQKHLGMKHNLFDVDAPYGRAFKRFSALLVTRLRGRYTLDRRLRDLVRMVAPLPVAVWRPRLPTAQGPVPYCE